VRVSKILRSKSKSKETMYSLEKAALLWLRVFVKSPNMRINVGTMELVGVSRRRSREILQQIRDLGAISLVHDFGGGSHYVINGHVAKSLLDEIDEFGDKIKHSGW